ncbi:MAG: threonine/serine exporter family protein [Bacteroidales bacterium]|nr:threonine/serine exporter family protein [Bacteroidales bacterium]
MEQKPDFAQVLEVASEAGHILLENGAEISRVEDIMNRIATHYGVSSGNFFVLSNGIFTSGKAEKLSKAGGQASTYANVAFIPIRGTQLSRVTAVNRLSYDISAGRCTLDQARERLEQIKKMPQKSFWEQMLATTLSAGAFSAVFGGSFLDCAAAAIAGLVLFFYIQFVSARYLSKIVGGISNALVASMASIVCWRLGMGDSLSDIIVGAIMPLIPGVPFTNGVRDLANSDYLAGLTRLTDAMLGFFCIAMGVSLGFMIDGAFFGGVIQLSGVTASPQTYGFVWQALAAFIGTWGFTVLYGVNREQYLLAGLIGTAGWLVYLSAFRFGHLSAPISSMAAALVVSLLSRFAAVPSRCPAQIFIICGIFTLVPGAGIFWFSYYLTASRFILSLQTGFMAIKVAIAIVLGIILAMELPQRMFSRYKGRTH